MRFGQYELLERVAVGGMAEVFRGRAVGAEGFEKWIAIKRVLPDLARDEAMVSMLLSEARIHAALSHRNIVQIHDLGVSEDGEYFIVLEYVEGHDLRAIIEALGARSERVPDPLALFIASEVAQGLHFAHDLRGGDGQALGLIHRDVSPSNILISFAGEVKLSDFGIAKRRQDASAVGTLKGNLVYMSPEQARRAPLDRRTDLFALGAVLFEMLTGYKLRDIRDEVSGWREVAAGQVRSARSLRPDLPEAFEQILMNALASEPAQRYADVGAFGAAIRSLRDHDYTLAGPNDLAEFVKVLNPPRRPRSNIEMSRVIRLLPEQTGRPGLPGNGAAGAARPRAQSGGGAATAPSAPAAAGTPGRTGRLGSGPAGVPGLAPGSLAGAASVPVMSMPEPRTPTPEPASVATTGSRANGSRPTPTSTQPGKRPTPLSLAVAPPPPPAPAPSSGTAWPAAGAAPPPSATAWSAAQSPSRPSLPSVPVVPAATSPAAAPSPSTQEPPPRPRLTKALFLLLLLVGAAALVHTYVAPLEVLAVWLRPTTLSVTSEPQGATVRLDGVVLPNSTPTQVEIKRDRQEHVLELSLSGFQEARQVLRYDRDLSLVHNVTLAPLGLPPAAPPPPPSRTRQRARKK